jgi:hypothetical protein
MSTVFTEGAHPGDCLLSEAPGNISYDNVTIPASKTITPNMVLGRLATPAAITVSAAASAGNTGNGVLTMADPAVNSKVKNGNYRAVCTAVATNGGTFRVEGPDGVQIGNATVGTPFNKEVKFTIADGATDFVVGDAFDILVGVEAPSDYTYVPFDPSGTDGSEIADAIALYPVVTGAGETKKTPVLRRICEVIGANLTWPAGITAAQKAAAIAQLASRHILVR